MDYTDEPVPLPPPAWPPEDSPGNGGDDNMQGPSGSQDPDVPDAGMPPGDDDDAPDLRGNGSGGFPPAGQVIREDRRPTYCRIGIELQYRPGGFPPHYPGGGGAIPVPDDTEPSVEITSGWRLR